MKWLIKDIARLIVFTSIFLGGLFLFFGFMALLVKGIEILPHYIGGFFTFLLYAAFYALLFAIIAKIKDDE
jgi:hypothetical protein